MSAYPTLLNESIDEKTIFLSNQFHATGSSFTYINRMQLSAQQELGFTTYPNPVTNHTTISYLLPSKSNVVLKLVDLAGKQLAVLFQKEQGAGLYKNIIGNFPKTRLQAECTYWFCKLIS